jgi:hypothetical protein
MNQPTTDKFSKQINLGIVVLAEKLQPVISYFYSLKRDIFLSLIIQRPRDEFV